MVAITSNPIIRLEFLRRFRSSIAAWGIPLLTLVPGIAVSIAYSSGTNKVNQGVETVGAAADVNVQFQGGFVGNLPQGMVISNTGELVPAAGQAFGSGKALAGVTVNQITSFGMPMYVTLFAAIIFTLMILVPAVVGGSISSERGNMTLQPLQLTALKPFDIVFGKLVASLAYLVLLLLCLTPVMATPFLVGGVPFVDVLRSFGLLLLLCVELAAVALAVSSLVKRPTAAIIGSLLVTGVVVAGPLIAMGLGFWSQENSGGLVAERSAFRLLGAASPVSVFTWSGKLGDFDPGGFADTSGRVLSVVFWVVVTVGSLLIARRAVTAPVRRDR